MNKELEQYLEKCVDVLHEYKEVNDFDRCYALGSDNKSFQCDIDFILNMPGVLKEQSFSKSESFPFRYSKIYKGFTFFAISKEKVILSG